ncbi:MAG: ATP-binding protein [Anaerolineales bacterium]|nr:ATP-binding protein [Anaerolineales bacterium]
MTAPLSFAARLRRQLIEPHPALEPESQSRARLLSILLLNLLLVTIVYELWYSTGTPVLGRAISNSKLLFIIGGQAFLLVTYWLSRTRYYQSAAAFFVIISSAAMYVSVILYSHTELDSAWLLLGLLTCSLFFSSRVTLFLLLATCMGVLIKPQIAPTSPWFHIEDTEFFLISMGLVIVGIAEVRQQDARRLEAQARALARHTKTMEALYATSLEINSQPNIPTLLNTITQRAMELLDTHSSGLYLVRPAEQMLELVAGCNLPEEYMGAKLKIGEGISGRIAQTGQPLAVEDYQRWEGRSKIYENTDFRRVLGVPMKISGQVIGVINVTDNQRNKPFSEAEIQLLNLLADQAAIAVENARLYEKVQKHAEELERRVAERTEQLEETNHDLQRALMARQKFLARASHELRTPLNAVLGFAQIMEMDNLAPRQKTSVQHILKAGRALLDLVNHLLDLTSLETGQISFSLEAVDLCEIIGKSIELMRPLTAERNIQLRAAPPPAEARVRADPRQLEQIILNLLSNAIKYNRDGGSVTVDCEARPNNRWRINIRDSGAGLSAEQCARLFIPFDQINANPAPESGAGLGLPLSKQLAESMGGNVGVESVVGEGSVFWVELPRIATAKETPQLSANTSAAVSAPNRVALYIENNPANLQLVEQILVYRPEIKLIAAMQGRLGLDLAREHQPDLILLDLNLPDLPGSEILRALQSDPRTRDIPVVVISEGAIPRQLERLMEFGAKTHLAKPMDVQKFLEILDELLQERK